MINETMKNILLEDKDSIVTPINKVSMVFAENSLLHAIMILNNTPYTSIPVLDYDNTLMGLISTSQIFKFLGEKINHGFQVLEEYKVQDALDKNFYTVREDFTIEEVIRALINHNFLCVVDRDNKLKGVIPRSNILKRFNFLVHEFDRNYLITNKNQRGYDQKLISHDFKKILSL